MTNEIVDLIEKRVENLYKDLANLKLAKNEIYSDFNDYSSKIDGLSSAYKNINNNIKTRSDCSTENSENDSDTDDTVTKRNNSFTESSEGIIIAYDENNNEIRANISKKMSNEEMKMFVENLAASGSDSQNKKER